MQLNVGAYHLLNSCGVALRVVAGQQHIGLVYEKNSDCRLLHFATDRDLRDELMSQNYKWMNLGNHFDRRLLESIRSFIIERINSVGSSVLRYGFDMPGVIYDSDGREVVGDDAVSVTCASYVLSLFHTIGIDLVDYESWPRANEADQKWQREILKLIVVESDDHYLEQLELIGARRFLPVEVAAATQLYFKAPYEEVRPLSLALVDHLAA